MVEQNTLYFKIKKVTNTISFLLKFWIYIIIFSLIGSILGFYITSKKDKIYIAKLNFVIEEESSKAGGFASIASSFGIGGSEGEGLFSSSNIMDFLKMRSLVEKALLTPIINNENKTYAQLFLEEYKFNESWKNNSKVNKIFFKPNENRSQFSIVKDSILGSIYKGIMKEKMLLITKPNKENSIIQIEVKSKNEKFSKYFSESLINVVSDYYVSNKTKKTRGNLIALEKQVDSVRNELLSSMVGVASSNDDVFGLNPAMNIKRIPSAQKQVDVQANTAILTELVKNLEVTKMSLLNQTPLIEVIDKPVFPLEFSRPNKILGMIVGGAVFFLISIGFIIFREYLKNQKNQYLLIIDKQNNYDNKK